MLSPKEKAFRLNSRKGTNWLIVSLIGFQYLLNLLHSWRIWRLDSIGCDLHGQLNSSLGKNLNRYSPVGAWFVIACVALAHNELEWPKWLIHGPPLVYEGSIFVRSLFSRLRRCFPLRSDAWKVMHHCLMISSLSSFLLKSHEVLQGKSGVRLSFFMSLSTNAWRGHSSLLRQSQNSFYEIGRVLIEEWSEVLWNSNWLKMIRVDRGVKYFLHYM